jgi:hypothetical protein
MPPNHGSVTWFFCRLAQILRDEGCAGLWFRCLALLGYRRLGFMVCRLDASAPRIESRVTVEVTRLTESDGEAYVKFRRGESMTDFHDRIAKGCVCYAAKHEGRLASVSWVAEGRGILRSLDSTFELKPDQVYLFDSFTPPDFRGL